MTADLIERLREFVALDGGDISDVEAAADEIERLRDRVTVLNLALMAARGGFALAYDAAGKGLNDEVLLHCGHHGAQADKVLGSEP